MRDSRDELAREMIATLVRQGDILTAYLNMNSAFFKEHREGDVRAVYDVGKDIAQSIRVMAVTLIDAGMGDDR